MSIFSFFGQKKAFSYPDAARKYGLKQLANVMTIIVRAKFSMDPFIRAGQVNQFLREEADAMRQAGGYPAKIARDLFDDPADYIGAMGETTEFPIDYPGGPQQILLQMTLEFMRQANDKDDAVKFRCAVVQNIALIEACAMQNAIEPGGINPQMAQQIQNNIDEADELLGVFIKKYRGYFKQFMGR